MNKLQLPLSVLTILACIVTSIIVNFRLGFYSISESEGYIPFFLSSKSFLYKLFYFPITDLYYRAREISNVFNILDTYIILIFTKLGFPHLLSGSYYLFLFLVMFTQLLFSRKYFGPHRAWMTLLTSVAFATSPAVFLSGMYFRPSKILVSFGISIAVIVLYKVSKIDIYSIRTRIGVIMCTFLLSIFLGVSDELGIVFTLLFGMSTVIWTIWAKNRKYLYASIGFFAGLGFLWIYRNLIGPWLVYTITGLTPTVWGVDGLPLSDIPSYGAAIVHLFHLVQLMFGNIPIELTPIPIAFLWLLTYLALQTSHKQSVKNIIFSGSLVILGIAFLSAILDIMRLRLPVVTWPEYSIIYYPLPFYTFLYVIFNLVSLRAEYNYPRLHNVLLVVFGFWALTNCIHIPEYMKELTSPEIKTSVYYNYAPRLIRALKNPKIPLSSFNLDHTNAVQAIRDKL